MRNRIKNLFKDKIIKGIILIFCAPLIAWIFKFVLDNGRLFGTLIRKLFGN